MKSYRELFTDKEMVREGIEHYSDLIKKSRSNPNYLFRRCFLYYVDQDYENALEDANSLLEINPDDAMFLCLRGLIGCKANNYSIAYRDIEASKQNNPRLIQPHYLLMALNFKAKDYGNAIETLFRIGENSLDNPRTYLYRGLCRLMNGQYNKAVLDFKEAGKISPTWEDLIKKLTVKAYLGGGIDQANMQKYSAAVLLFEHLVETDPEDANGHFFLGEAYMNIDEWESARENFERAQELGKGSDVEQDAVEMIEILNKITRKQE
jgi:tetratricopeptide (TPR) repeat protein